MKQIIVALALVAASADAQTIRQGGASTLPNEVTCGLNNTSPGCYGHNGRNEAAGIGTNLGNGFGNYGTAGTAAPPAASNTPFATGIIGVGANGIHSMGGLFRSTTARAGGFNAAGTFWALNTSGMTTGLYISLSALPASDLDFEAQMQPGGLVIDTKASGAPAIVARDAGAVVASVPVAGQFKLHTAGRAKPTCDASRRGELWFAEAGSGVADTLEACGKDQADAYVWKPVAIF